MLTREQIMKVTDAQIERVEVPEWGGHLFVRVMTVREREALERATVKGNTVDTAHWRERLMIATCCDEAGEPLFTPDDEEFLSTLSIAAVERVLDVAQRLNGMTPEDVDDLGKDLDVPLNVVSSSQ